MKDWIGVISDTHGLLRPQALAALQGASHIIHAGDVGQPEILDQLRELAPLTVVRGNVDLQTWATALPLTDTVTVGDALIYVIHQLDMLDLNPAAAGVRAIIYGHSHQPASEWRNGVLYLNPGSAGPKRFQLPISLARLEVKDGNLRAEHIYLDV